MRKCIFWGRGGEGRVRFTIPRRFHRILHRDPQLAVQEKPLEMIWKYWGHLNQQERTQNGQNHEIEQNL